MNDPFAVDRECCRGRQQRLLEHMRQAGIDACVLFQREHVQWLTGLHLPWFFQTFAQITQDGQVALVAPAKMGGDAAADRLIPYTAKHHSTLRNDQMQAACEAFGHNTLAQARRVGVEFSTAPHYLHFDGELVDVEAVMYRLRRRKDADELRMMQKAMRATEQMYLRAREIIRPGVHELQVFNELQSVAVEALGEPLTRTGNDYQCGSRGGPPRANRPAEAGELYILDLGPLFEVTSPTTRARSP